MIKRFNKDSGFGRRGKANWPESPDRVKEIFEPRYAYRKLSVMVDAHLIPQHDTSTVSSLTKNILLHSLINNDLVQAYRYADSGPPSDVKPLSVKDHDWLKDKFYKGWVVADDFQEQHGYWPVNYAETEDSFTHSAVSGNIVQHAETDIASRAYAKLSQEERASKRRADMLALEVANQAIDADILVTDRDYLLRGEGLVSRRGVTICNIDEAIALISLYLRAQGEYVLPTGGGVRHTCNRGLFYWVGTRELLPEGWRWFSACVYHSSGSGDDKLLGLGGSVLSRVQRAIEARDRVHIALNRTTNNDINDDALGNLDHVLMLLMGAVDASARVAHYVLGLDGNEYQTSWQKKEWLKKVGKERQELAKLFEVDSHHWHTLEILRLLRNSIHGEALQGVTLQADGKTDTMMNIPKHDEEKILASMDALGGRDRWGYKPFAPGHDNIKPGYLVDTLIEEFVKLMNDIMRETPIEELSHIKSVNLTNTPPEDKPDRGIFNTFSEWNRLAIRWQLGL